MSQILRDADRKATDLLTTNRNYLDAVTKELAHREELLRTEIEDVLRANGMDIPAEKPKQDAASEIAPNPSAAGQTTPADVQGGESKPAEGAEPPGGNAPAG